MYIDICENGEEEEEEEDDDDDGADSQLVLFSATSSSPLVIHVTLCIIRRSGLTNLWPRDAADGLTDV